jgi:hypothetical protein
MQHRKEKRLPRKDQHKKTEEQLEGVEASNDYRYHTEHDDLAVIPWLTILIEFHNCQPQDKLTDQLHRAISLRVVDPIDCNPT